MTKFTSTSKRKIIIAAAVTLVLAALIGACAIYLGDYYPADIEAIQAYLPRESGWEKQPDGTIVFKSDDAAKGFIFYPGGKVEYTAYLPLMQALSEKGVMCVLVEMPFNLAVLDIHAADSIQKEYPEIEDWYIGGHSLGGSMAASYAASHTDDLAGRIFDGRFIGIQSRGAVRIRKRGQGDERRKI